MRSYECTVALHTDLGDVGIREQVDRIQAIVAEHGGAVKEAVDWGLRELAYPIRKQSRAAFWIVVFEGTGATVAELERQMRISDHVLRYITVRIDPDRPSLDLGRSRRAPDEGAGAETPPTTSPPAEAGASETAPVEPAS